MFRFRGAALSFLLALIVATAGILATYPAHAAGEFTPLQPAMSGQWADPYAVGEGFSLVVRDTPAGRMVFGEYFAARSCDECAPVWTWFQGAAGDSEFVLYATNALTADPTPNPSAAPVGSLRLSVLGCGAVVALIDSGPPSVPLLRHLAPVVYELGAGECYTCPGVDVSPPLPACGF